MIDFSKGVLPVIKLYQHILALASAALMGLAPLAQAEPTRVQTQVPGYYRTQLGQFEITALYDGAIELDSKLLRNTSAVELQVLLSCFFVGNPKMQTAVSAYLINTGNHLVLVDTGAAKLFGPALGYVLQNMKTSGYESAQVDTDIVTHLHCDHVSGLNDASGQPHFPKARILVVQVDNDFWLSQKIANGAPTEVQPLCKMERDSAAPYLAS
jgi:glyoxylase-like metal-dependent hydrolase (beta-lactamase superfamily II)